MEMDHLDKLAASVLDGYLVRKDLVRTFQPSISSSNVCC